MVSVRCVGLQRGRDGWGGASRERKEKSSQRQLTTALRRERENEVMRKRKKTHHPPPRITLPRKDEWTRREVREDFHEVREELDLLVVVLLFGGCKKPSYLSLLFFSDSFGPKDVPKLPPSPATFFCFCFAGPGQAPSSRSNSSMQ